MVKYVGIKTIQSENQADHDFSGNDARVPIWQRVAKNGNIWTPEYSPIDRFIIGLRYRMMLIDEMNSFSKRYLNSVELTAGYLF